MSSPISLHSFLWSLCAIQFGLLSLFAFSPSSSGKNTNKMSTSSNNSVTDDSTGQQQIRRITMFKIPDPENQKKLVDAYDVLAKVQQKGGQPYILSTRASVLTDPRSKGYTVVAETQFADLDDMKFYDNECAAHLTVKKATRQLGVTEPPLIVYY